MDTDETAGMERVVPGVWEDEIDVRGFIQKNYTPYEGDGSFLSGPTQRTREVREKFEDLLRQERGKRRGLKSGHGHGDHRHQLRPGVPGQEKDIIVGLQTDEPLKRACNPFGGMRMVRSACKAYGYEVSEKIEDEFKFHKTHNDGVFSAYTPEIKEARHCGLITGLPDAYGRGRIIGDYRRVALYGIDRLIQQKKADKIALGDCVMSSPSIRAAEELNDQIKALEE